MALTNGEYLRASGEAACESRSAAETRDDLSLDTDDPVEFAQLTCPIFVMAGLTGTNEIRLVTNLADALSVEDTAGDLIVIDTTTGSQVITITPAVTVTGVITANGGITLGDSQNVVANTGTGSQIATAVGQKLGFWAVTPIVQPAHADQADQGAMTGVAVGDLVATQNTGWGASSEANFDKIHDAIDKLVADVTALDTLLTAIRTALVNAGLMKGAA